MEISNNYLEEINEFTICPNNKCENIPKIEYIEDIFCVLINCNKDSSENKKIMDINDYMSQFSNQIKYGHNHNLKKIQYLNEFHFCLECKKTFDNKSYAENHNDNHSKYIFNYKTYYNYCLQHIKKYIKYCKNCDTSLFELCLKNSIHFNHNLINLEDIA